ncbi:MAG: DUF1778 domain-containing protein [Gammaproteobacteria bacterium]
MRRWCCRIGIARYFFDALANPPEPNERLRRAVAEHKLRVAP